MWVRTDTIYLLSDHEEGSLTV